MWFIAPSFCFCLGQKDSIWHSFIQRTKGGNLGKTETAIHGMRLSRKELAPCWETPCHTLFTGCKKIKRGGGRGGNCEAISDGAGVSLKFCQCIWWQKIDTFADKNCTLFTQDMVLLETFFFRRKPNCYVLQL
jgi:hypothetical protein